MLPSNIKEKKLVTLRGYSFAVPQGTLIIQHEEGANHVKVTRLPVLECAGLTPEDLLSISQMFAMAADKAQEMISAV